MVRERGRERERESEGGREGEGGLPERRGSPETRERRGAAVAGSERRGGAAGRDLDCAGRVWGLIRVSGEGRGGD